MNWLLLLAQADAFAEKSDTLGTAKVIVIAVLVILALIIVLFVANFFGLWLQAFFSRADVSIASLIGMRLRKVDLREIVLCKIQAVKAGMTYITVDEMENHYLAGGRVHKVINALIASSKAGIELDWRTASAIDLAGRDVEAAIRTSVDPKVIDVPNPVSGRTTIDAVAKDGIQLKVKARVTVRTNIKRLVGGATEETIIARVGEGIVSAIGSATSHKEVLENPDRISKAVLAKGLDAGTAFEILSIDIADVDVGDNIGARLQVDQAGADLKRAQAEAEKRRAMAVALEQENKAKIEENRALVVLAESEVPRAMAEAFRSGNMGIMDYYKMRNVQADTSMRESIAKPPVIAHEQPK